jgi:hypothetical protein
LHRLWPPRSNRFDARKLRNFAFAIVAAAQQQKKQLTARQAEKELHPSPLLKLGAGFEDDGFDGIVSLACFNCVAAGCLQLQICACSSIVVVATA